MGKDKRQYKVSLLDVTLVMEFDPAEGLGPTMMQPITYGYDGEPLMEGAIVKLPGDLASVVFKSHLGTLSPWHRFALDTGAKVVIPPPPERKPKTDRNAGLTQTELPT